VNISFDLKTLYGQNQFPVAAGRGKGKVEISAKSGEFNPQLWTSLIFGIAPTTNVDGVVDSAIISLVSGTTTYNITSPYSGKVTDDLGALNLSTGQTMQKVASSPSAGQYSFSNSNGYIFSATDSGAGYKISVSYSYTAAANALAPDAQSFEANNELMGYTPSCSLYLSKTYGGRSTHMYFPFVVSNDFSLSMKNEDFTVPDIKMTGLADSTGKVFYINTI